MRVVEGTSYELSDNSWQKPEVELNDADFERALVEWNVSPEKAAKMPLLLRYQLLSALARKMLFAHQISQRRHDVQWVNAEAAELDRALQEELSNLFHKIHDL